MYEKENRYVGFVFSLIRFLPRAELLDRRRRQGDGHCRSRPRYLVAGSVQNIPGRYNVSFRINNAETNEIRATFNKAYSLADIETGLAAKEAVKELLAGMGVTLTEADERTLLTVQAVEAKAISQLAKGMTAAKSII